MKELAQRCFYIYVMVNMNINSGMFSMLYFLFFKFLKYLRIQQERDFLEISLFSHMLPWILSNIYANFYYLLSQINNL